MIIKNNPFITEIYNQEWMNHFHYEKTYNKFDFIKGIAFTKNKYLPLYTNVGKYKSSGISYEIDTSGQFKDYKGKVFLIYDIPEYFEVNTKSKSKNLGVKVINQYDGYLVDIRSFNAVEDYLRNQFNSKQRRSILSRLRKLEDEHDISYEFHSSKLDEQQFEELFEELYRLMDRQFGKKNEKNSHSPLEIKEWHKSLFFKLLEKNQASFSVIKSGNTTISSCFRYNSDNVVFSAIPVLDMDYVKYGLGNIRTLKGIEWAIRKGFEYYDLGKGSYGYKHRWASKKYKFQYQIFYDKKSIFASSIAFLLKSFFSIKQFMRQIKYFFKK